jgi:hypothetical protein
MTTARNFYLLLSCKRQINDNSPKTGTMIPLRTTALIAALVAAVSLVGAVTPVAFAQNTVTATQSNSFTADISQSITQEGDGNSASQGFCLQVNQQNAAAGNTATNNGNNQIGPGSTSGSGDDNTGIDCS